MDEAERAAQTQLAAQGDADALQRLIVYYHRPLHGVVVGKMDATMRRRVDPDDILQEAYVAAFQTVSGCQFDGPAGFYKWLEKIALNELRNQERALRRQKRDIDREIHVAEIAPSSYPDLVQRLTASDPTPSRRITREEAVAAVVSSLARLTDDQRSVVRLRFLEEKPVADVAARLGKTEAAVHKLCYRALKALHQLMGSITGYLSRL